MGLFNKNKRNNKPEQRALTEFEKDVQELMGRPDINSKEEICKIEYEKAKKYLTVTDSLTFQHAFDIMQGLAKMFNYIPAIMWLGHLNESNLNNTSTAADWYKKAADLGDGEGCRCYADMLMTGRGIPANEQLAMEYYLKASNLGIPEASFVVGEYHRTTGDIQKALAAYEKAAQSGYKPAIERVNQLKKHDINNETVETMINESDEAIKVTSSNETIDTQKELYYKLVETAANTMHHSNIISSPQLKYLYNDAGIAKYVFNLDLNNKQLSPLRREFSDTYLLILGMHAFGAGVFTVMNQGKFKKPVSDFNEEEIKSIKTVMLAMDPYELALNSLGISIDSNNKRVLDHVISTCVAREKELTGNDAFNTENLKMLFQALFDAGVTLIMK